MLAYLSTLCRSPRCLRPSIVGSLPKPAWLAEPNMLRAPWRLAGAELREAQDDAVRLAILDQEDAGLDVVTDGEVRRRHYIWGFLDGLTGIDTERLDEEAVARRPLLRDDRGGAPRRSGGAAGAGVRRRLPLRARAHRPHAEGHAARPDDDRRQRRRRALRRRRSKTLAMRFAEILNAEARELAEAGADVIQFDEPCFNIYLDEVEAWGIEALSGAWTA